MTIVGRHTEREWDSLLQAWRWRCFYCGNPLQISYEGCRVAPENELTKDHLVPISRGGVDFIENIVPACLRCNRMKGKQTADEFRESRPVFSTFLKEKENFPTCIAFGTSSEVSPEEENEPGLLRKLCDERDNISWAWRNPYF